MQWGFLSFLLKDSQGKSWCSHSLSFPSWASVSLMEDGMHLWGGCCSHSWLLSESQVYKDSQSETNQRKRRYRAETDSYEWECRSVPHLEHNKHAHMHTHTHIHTVCIYWISIKILFFLVCSNSQIPWKPRGQPEKGGPRLWARHLMPSSWHQGPLKDSSGLWNQPAAHRVQRFIKFQGSSRWRVTLRTTTQSQNLANIWEW